MKIRPLHDRVLIKRKEAEETRLVMNLAQFAPAAHMQPGRVVVDSALNPATRDRSTYSGIYYVAKTTHAMAVLFSGCAGCNNKQHSAQQATTQVGIEFATVLKMSEKEHLCDR
jgi:hypothetical protein